ncbi:alpha/beta hydrolase [Aquibacillus salsiterrae]|uniref:Alpha/beta hydrolase-fold protein n=1 Tax=Aquibacillus salsiterrae TaxID=2950439 RepID=A0A9X3WGT5_9BACI|nr:alpha/beta hydrolase-fold protein [Aquibacillus salsiterrae]MDC3417179.1 alpha/beta hydrolase-fold protein [Aquibacillus salsiterrae]
MGRKGKMIDKQIESSYLNEIITVKWYLPEAFTPLNNYYICIMQDGDDYFQLGRIATLSDQLHEDGDIDNTVFVGIHYQDRYDRQAKYHPNGDKNQAYINFLIHEVVPMLDEEIPGVCVGSSRALMGDSLAGTLALMVASKYPNTFGKVIMQSPFVNDAVLNSINEASDLDKIDIYHTIGKDETEVKTTDGKTSDFLTPNRELNELLSNQKINYSYHELDGNHTWKSWQPDLPHALCTMFGWE